MAIAATVSPPEVDDIVRLKDGQEGMHAAVFDVCKRNLTGWSDLGIHDVEFDKITGGITNILLKVCPAERYGLEPVAVKVFGAKTELLIDREIECAVAKDLADQGFGPKVLCVFGNGRVEQFLYCKTMMPEEMCSPVFIPRIAQRLAKFHAATVQLPKQTQSLFDTIWSWYDMATQLDFSHDPVKAEAYARVDFARMRGEIAQLQAACGATQSPLVFGHNDLLAGNIVVLQDKGFDPAHPDLSGPLQFIDFEYGAYTPRGFDIGNHFNEYAGFECDYSRYPNREQQQLFFVAYMGQQLSSQQLDQLCAEADVYSLASHVYWGVWALIQARYSPVDFDYMGYSALRWAECRRRWGEFMSRAQAVFGAQQ